MLRSLRFRLPALFLGGILLAGVVSTVIGVWLFQQHIRGQSLRDLRREADGIVELYRAQAVSANDQGRKAPTPYSASRLEQATGDRIYYVGIPIFPGQSSGLRRLSRTALDWPAIQDGRVLEFEFVPPGLRRRYLAVAHPLQLGSQTFGAIVVATPSTVVRNAWLTLLRLLGVSLVGGILVAGVLAWLVARRITGPVLGLSRAADEVAEGRYDVAVPDVPGGGEIGHLADRFGEMARRLAEAEELERNFVMTVSHELRTPLTAIRGHVEAMREGLVEEPEARAASLDVVALEASRLERLVDDLVDLAKLEARRFTLLREEVDMERLVEQAYGAFGEEARRRGIDYRREVSARPVIVADGDRVLQIVANLLSNAFRWTPDGGTIELTLGQDDGRVTVTVGDSGPGVPSEEQDRIFRPFWTRDDGGTGLGLAIARELAVALGGGVTLESEPGGGSRFELVLPAG